MKPKKRPSLIIVALLLGVASLAFREPQQPRWSVPWSVGVALERVGANVEAGVSAAAALVGQKNAEMQGVYDERMERNDRRINREDAPP